MPAHPADLPDVFYANHNRSMPLHCYSTCPALDKCTYSHRRCRPCLCVFRRINCMCHSKHHDDYKKIAKAQRTKAHGCVRPHVYAYDNLVGYTLPSASHNPKNIHTQYSHDHIVFEYFDRAARNEIQRCEYVSFVHQCIAGWCMRCFKLQR